MVVVRVLTRQILLPLVEPGLLSVEISSTSAFQMAAHGLLRVLEACGLG
jgi:hypothetical protein